jgi:superfamily II RNA helicase
MRSPATAGDPAGMGHTGRSMGSLAELVKDCSDEDEVLTTFVGWAEDQGLSLYPAQEEALLEILAGNHVILSTPTGSGKSLVALGAHTAALSQGKRSFYTAPIKALVSEKFFALCHQLGSENVGMLTGDASVNPTAPVICCTAEILANMALRSGADADVAQVVMDEFHYYADPDRGWAWQVPLLELTGVQFILMSATLGDVRRFETDLTRRTGRPTVHVTSTTRPVPLDYEYRRTLMHATVEDLLAEGKAPLYIVHFTQASAVERAQSLTSINVCTREEKDAIAEAIGRFRFSPGFGKVLNRYVRHGIGVHHAGMLPKYRLLIERLAQEGLLKVICGTDTLGVGINVPIRTVVFTQLAKYDGVQSRLLTAREFHQIAGRAGRAGYDAEGSVVVQAPDHVVENERSLAKAGDDPKKRRKVVRAKPPRGFVNWSDDTFNRLVAAPPEPLTSHFSVSHAMVLNVLDRPARTTADGRTEDGCGALRRLLTDNHEARPAQRRHIRRAISIYRSLSAADIVERLDEPDDLGRLVRVKFDLQDDFALNHPLSPFVLEAIPRLDVESDTYALDVLSIIEATLDDPFPILAAQLDRVKSELVARLKRDGVEYEQRMEELSKCEHPKPLREFTYDLFDQYRLRHPWVGDHNIRPKSVARDLYEKALGFAEYIAEYKTTRSEGLLLRYLGDAYKGLVQNVPEDAKTDELLDVTEWLGELVRQVDSSLLDEWDALHDGTDSAAEAAEVIDHTRHRLDERPPPVTGNERAFTVMVRNEAFRRVELAARRDWGALEEADGEHAGAWTAAQWAEAFAPYFAEHATIGIGPEARNRARFQVDTAGAASGTWTVRQILEDPDGHDEWGLELAVDLAASDEEGRAVLVPTAVRRL